MMRSWVLEFDQTKEQYIEGSENGGVNNQPESYHLDCALLQRPGIADVMFSLLYDYRTNVELHPEFKRY